MKAIVLSANAPVFSKEPVFNLPIGSHPLIDLQISILRNAGIEKIDVVVGHEKDKFHRSDVRCIKNDRWQSTGSVGSLLSAMDEEDDTLVVYGDTIFESKIIADLLKSREDFTACCLIDDKSRFNERAVVENGYLQRVGADPSSFFVFTGLLLVRKSKLRYLKSKLKSEHHVGDLMNALLEDGEKIICHIVNSGWMELRSENALHELEKNGAFLSRIIQLHVDWTQRAKKYDQLDWVNRDVLMNGILDVVKTLKVSKALDLGTGTGKVLNAVKGVHPGAECWGVDYSEAMLERVQNKEKFTLKVANAEDLKEIPSDTFDLVTARMVFHHVNDLQKATAEVHRILRKGGCFVLCEGNPPSIRTAKWYTEMFRYKEDRNTLTEIDLINILINGQFQDITTKTIIMSNCSLNNWLDNSGIPQENIDIIKKMHFEAEPFVRDDYKMNLKDGDCFMEWKFSVTYGTKP